MFKRNNQSLPLPITPYVYLWSYHLFHIPTLANVLFGTFLFSGLSSPIWTWKLRKGRGHLIFLAPLLSELLPPRRYSTNVHWFNSLVHIWSCQSPTQKSSSGFPKHPEYTSYSLAWCTKLSQVGSSLSPFPSSLTIPPVVSAWTHFPLFSFCPSEHSLRVTLLRQSFLKPEP